MRRKSYSGRWSSCRGAINSSSLNRNKGSKGNKGSRAKLANRANRVKRAKVARTGGHKPAHRSRNKGSSNNKRG